MGEVSERTLTRQVCRYCAGAGFRVTAADPGTDDLACWWCAGTGAELVRGRGMALAQVRETERRPDADGARVAPVQEPGRRRAKSLRGRIRLPSG